MHDAVAVLRAVSAEESGGVHGAGAHHVRQLLSRGDTHTIDPKLRLPASFATYVPFTTHAWQLHAEWHSPHESNRQR